MPCQLCGSEDSLIKSHIIPKPFFVAYGKDDRAPRVLSNSRGVHPKRVRTGFYDSDILCAKCDQRIGVWDQYGVDLLLKELPSFEPFPHVKGRIAFMRPSFDYARLRLFLLSVLWRAGISSHPMFTRVKLGPYAARLRELLSASEPGGSDDFCTLLSVFTIDGHIVTTGVPIMDPFRERWHEANAYRLSLGAVTAYIKTDRARFPPSFEQLAVRKDHPLFLLERDFANSSEATVARAIALAPQNRNAFKRR
jgi:hypothetical protein